MDNIIDFHAHILPGVDHGSLSTEESLWQLRAAKEAGVSLVIGTPHFYPEQHLVEEFVAQRNSSAAQLKKAGGDKIVRFRAGAEVLLCEGLDRMEGLEKLCLEDTNVLLLEMPFLEVTDEMFRTMERLEQGGKVKPILAHIDRYPPKTVAKALSRIPRAQINAYGLTEFFGTLRLKPYLQSGAVYALGSDIHRKGTNYKAFAKALKKISADIPEMMKRTEKLLNSR